MSTPWPPSSLPSDSNPNATATPPAPLQHSPVVALAPSSAAIGKKPQPLLWTHEETLLLADVYRDKWYSLGRGHLKAGHWEEIAASLSGRSGVERSATQCRHKIEKIRKRFRAERQSVGPTSVWPYYALMEELESRPTPIQARPQTRLPPHVNYNEDDGDGDHNDEDEDDDDDGRHSKSRSINYILRRPSAVNRFAAKVTTTAIPTAHEEEGVSWGYGERVKKKKRKVEGRGGAKVVAEEIRGLAERVMVMEKRKMELLREIERKRMEMEVERIELIQNSQDRLLHFISTAFASSSSSS